MNKGECYNGTKKHLCAYTHKLGSFHASNQRIHVIIETNLKDILMINHFCFIMGGANYLRCTKILSQCHFFLFFLPSIFLPCKNTFMHDYDEIQYRSSLKYSLSKFFDNF